MTNFGKWLGKSNGKSMLCEIATDCTPAQFRSAITTYCLLFDVNVDTREWDDLMRYMYDSYNSWFNNFNEFDLYMRELLV